MRGVNKVIIIGNLGADPEVRQFTNGGSVTNISVATSEQWNDKQTGERREATEWHRISLYNRLGEIAAQYLRKGSSVYIEGSLRTRKYQDENGQDRYVTEIRADNMQMLGGNSGYQNTGHNAYQGQYANQQAPMAGYQPNQGYQNQPQNFQQGNQFQSSGSNQGYQAQANRQSSSMPMNQNQMSGNQTEIPKADTAVDDDIPFMPIQNAILGII